MGQDVRSNGEVTQNNHNKTTTKKRLIPEKTFETRNSLLTDLFDTNPHIRTIRHIFYAVLITLLVNTILHDYCITNDLKIGMHLFYRGFGKFYIAVCIWLCYHLSCSGLFFCFNLWAKSRINFTKSNNFKTWDLLWSSVLVVYYLISFAIPPAAIAYFGLAEASSGFILAEQIRLIMKQHAFVRECAKEVISFKPHSDKELSSPKYTHFLYFLFAPTLIYRNEYPRTQTINWNHAFRCLVEFFAIILFYCFILLRFMNPLYEDFGLRKFTYYEIIVAIASSAIPSTLLLMCIFYLILHCTQNFFAEILRFGDRQFYKDWWTCSGYQEYFRLWNIVVHDWLFTYIYKDVYQVLTNGNQNVAKLSVFLVSALAHEYLMYYTLGFFFPVMFMQFFVAAFLSFLRFRKSTIRNVFFWYELITGCGIMASMYTLEFYARYNLPKEYVTWKDYLLPKWIMCDCFV